MASTEKKLKRIKNNVGADFVDSTQPIPNILEHFSNHNNTVFRHYCRVLGRRSVPKAVLPNQYHYLTPGHPLNTFKDDWDGVLPSRYFEQFLYNCTLPRVISPMRHKGCTDPLTGFMRNKLEWKNKLLTYIGVTDKSKYLNKFKKLNDKVVQCPKFLLDFAAHLESDPLPHFDCPYNWYYSGAGNMHLVYLDGEHFVLHSELHTLYLTKIALDNLKVDQNHVLSFECREGDNICETIYSDNHIVALRTLTRVIILKLTVTHSSFITIKKLKEIENAVTYTSISFDPHHKDILYVTALDNNLTIVNIDMMKGRSVKLTETDSLVNNWSSVAGIDRYSYCHVSRKSIKIYDKRTNTVAQMLDDPSDVSDEPCNEFSVATKCKDIPLLYAATNHHVFLADTRSLKKKPKFLQRWTHHMKCVPTYISLCKFEMMKDILCISSQWYEDMCILPNDSDCFDREVQTTGIFMPFRPPTIEQTLNAARMKMLCLDIYNPIETRIYTSITGSSILEKDGNYLAMTQNALGDIISYTLYPNHIHVEDDGLERFHEWCQHIRDDTTKYEVTGIVNIAKLWNKLRKVPEDHKFNEEKLAWEEVKYSEQEVVEAFERDKLDGGLLDVWVGEAEDVPKQSLAINLHFSDSE